MIRPLLAACVLAVDGGVTGAPDASTPLPPLSREDLEVVRQLELLENLDSAADLELLEELSSTR
ncbi:MAG: hypothetical protein INH41_21095 [Myxococcaceae bacterium]|jgi:hypothetical protein|nr:hypothetical protein [Myxococcaceae bacterium]MCA3014890.1 hypothetical protein [Myxococcaceae bacterium]